MLKEQEDLKWLEWMKEPEGLKGVKRLKEPKGPSCSG